MKPPETPQPSLLLILCSLVVLATCLVLASAALATFASAWDPCALMGGVILLPLPVALAWQQYRSVFRSNGSAAFASAILLILVGSFAWLASMTMLVEMQAESEETPLTWLVSLVAVGLIASLSGWLNLRWARQLRNFAAPWRLHRRSFSLRELLAATAVAACMTALVIYFVQSTPPKYAEHVSRDGAPLRLPPNATDVSFCQGYRGTVALEFTTDEATFTRWAHAEIGSYESRAANIPIEPITAPHTIERYAALSPDLTEATTVTITDGLYYLWSKEDRLIHTAFDRRTQRAYYAAHFH